MTKLEEEVLEEYTIPTDKEVYMDIDLKKGIIKVPENKEEYLQVLDKTRALDIIRKYNIDETRLTPNGLIFLTLLDEREVNLDVILANEITEREALNILYMLEKGDVLPEEIVGDLREEPLESKLKLVLKVENGIVRKQVVKLVKPYNGIGDKCIPKTYWLRYGTDYEYEELLGYKKGK